MLSEAVDWVFVFISVESARVVVSVLLLDHFTFLVVEKVQRLVVVCEPRVVEDLVIG